MIDHLKYSEEEDGLNLSEVFLFFFFRVFIEYRKRKIRRTVLLTYGHSEKQTN